MSLKIVLVLCAIISLHSVANAQHELTPEGRNLIENVQAAIHKVEEKVLGAIEAAKVKLYHVIDDLNTFAQNLLGDASIKINGVVDGLLREINELKHKAEELGIDVSDCVREQEEQLKAIAPKLIGELRKCVEDNIKKAQTLVKETIDEFSSVVKQVTALKDRYLGCITAIAPVGCLTKVLADTTALAVKLPVTITEQVAKATTLVETIQSDLTLCASNIVVQVTGDGRLIANNIITCIREKIPVHH